MEEKVVKSRFKRVCVFCGSSTGKRDCYRDAAIELGQELVPIVCSICMPFSVSCSPQNQTDVLCLSFSLTVCWNAYKSFVCCLWRCRGSWILFTEEGALAWWVWFLKPCTVVEDTFLGTYNLTTQTFTNQLWDFNLNKSCKPPNFFRFLLVLPTGSYPKLWWAKRYKYTQISFWETILYEVSYYLSFLGSCFL